MVFCDGVARPGARGGGELLDGVASGWPDVEKDSYLSLYFF